MKLWNICVLFAFGMLLMPMNASAKDVCEEARFVCRANGGSIGIIVGMERECGGKCRKDCRQKKKACKKGCGPSNCRTYCKKKRLRGKRLRTCTRTCRAKRTVCKKKCRAVKRSCKSICRKYNKTSHCKRARRALFPHLLRAAQCTISFMSQNYNGGINCIKNRAKDWIKCAKLAAQCHKQNK